MVLLSIREKKEARQPACLCEVEGDAKRRAAGRVVVPRARYTRGHPRRPTLVPQQAQHAPFALVADEMTYVLARLGLVQAMIVWSRAGGKGRRIIKDIQEQKRDFETTT